MTRVSTYPKKSWFFYYLIWIQIQDLWNSKADTLAPIPFHQFRFWHLVHRNSINYRLAWATVTGGMQNNRNRMQIFGNTVSLCILSIFIWINWFSSTMAVVTCSQIHNFIGKFLKNIRILLALICLALLDNSTKIQINYTFY